MRFPSATAKTPPDVSLPLLSAEGHLGFGGDGSPERTGVEGDAVSLPDGSGHKQGLVEAPLPQALQMQGNRHDKGRLPDAKTRIVARSHEVPQG